MTRRAPLLVLVLLLLLGCGRSSGEDPGEAPSLRADVVLRGGRIHTLREDRASTVEALAIGGGKVLAVGSNSEIEGFAGAGTRVIELDGRTVVPGLVDAHAHLRTLGDLMGQADLRGTVSVEDCVARVRQIESGLAAGDWLQGRGWDQNDWEVQDYPDRRILDEAFGDRPTYLRRVDGHAGWANSAALRRAGIDATTPDPEGGEILRDARGEPTGILVDEAEDLVLDVIPDPSDAEHERRFRIAAEEAARQGLTGVHEMGISLRRVRALQRLAGRGELPVRVVIYLGGDEVLAEFEGGPVRPEPTSRVRIEGVKLYADGALGSRGAALLEDYSDRSGHRGLLIQSPDALTAMSQRAFARGFGVAIHAIGDRANRVAIDAIVAGHAAARARDASLPELAALRPRIEHAQILDPADFARFPRHGILPSMQPTHCTSDMPWAESRLGTDRLVGAYAWRTLRDLGCIVPLGSDFPVEEVSPLLGLYAARTRQQPDGQPEGGWSPHQRLTALESLLGFTVWPAAALGIEDLGRLEPGYRADLVVLDADPLGDDASALLETEVLATMVEGRFVHEATTNWGTR